MNIDAVQTLDRRLPKNVPALADYDAVSDGWAEAEYRADTGVDNAVAGFWEGEPGSVSFDSWPYNELCVILTGRVAIEDESGQRAEFGPNESFLVPKGFKGRWITLEPTSKIFAGLDVDPA